MLKHPRAKGKVLEKKIAQMLIDTNLDPFAKPQLMSGAVKGWEGDIHTTCNLHFEAKNTENWQVMPAYEQARNSNPNPARKINIAVFSKNRLPEPFAFLTLQDFFNVYWHAVNGVKLDD